MKNVTYLPLPRLDPLNRYKKNTYYLKFICLLAEKTKDLKKKKKVVPSYSCEMLLENWNQTVSLSERVTSTKLKSPLQFYSLIFSPQ